jgi:hypothetical protein
MGDHMGIRIGVNPLLSKKIVLGTIIIGFLATIGTILYVDYNSGNFVFLNDQTKYEFGSIEIAEELDFEMSTSHLEVSSSVDAIGMTYSSLKLDEIIDSEGQYIDLDHQYLAYSFYIKNTGNVTKSISYYVRLTEVYNQMDDCIRILIIEDDTIYKMYQKADQPDLDNSLPHYNQMPIGNEFETSLFVFRDTIEDFKPGSIKSFRVIIWLEEQDPDVVGRGEIGHVKGEFVFTVINNYPDLGASTNVSLSTIDKLWIDMSRICCVSFEIHYETQLGS